VDLPYSEAQRDFELGVYADAMESPHSELTVEELIYTWQYEKFYEDPESLFFSVKVFDFLPNIGNITVEPDPGGWGETFNYTAEVWDQKEREVEVYLWEREIGEGWEKINETFIEGCGPENKCNVSLTYDDFQPEDMGVREFKFNATNEDGSAETGISIYDIEESDIEVENIRPDSGAEINRSDTTQIEVQVYDYYTDTYPEGVQGRVFVSTHDVDTFDEGTVMFTDEDGIFRRTYSAQSDDHEDWCEDHYTLGDTAYYGGTEGADNYTDEFTEPTEFELIGDLETEILEPGEENFTQGDEVSFLGEIQDDCNQLLEPNTNFTVETDGFDDVCTHEEGYSPGDGQRACDLDTDNHPYGWYNVTMESEEENYNPGLDSDEQSYFLASVPEFTQPKVDKEAGGWGESPFRFSTNLTNEDDTSTDIYFWVRPEDGEWELNGTDSCAECDDEEFVFERNFTRDEIGDWEFKFNASSTSGFSNESSVEDFTVERNKIGLEHIHGDGEAVNRPGYMNDNKENLSVQIVDLHLDEVVTDIPTEDLRVNVTTDGGDYQSYEPNQTENYYRYEFSADCSYRAMEQDWWFELSDNPYYKDNVSDVYDLEVLGDLSTDVTSPEDLEGYEGGEKINFTASVTSDCPEEELIDDADLNFTAEGSHAFDEFEYTCPEGMHEEDGEYFCEFDSAGTETGDYNLTAEAEREFYHPDIDKEVDSFRITAPVTLEEPRVFPDPAPWGRNRTFQIYTAYPDDVEICLWDKSIGDVEFEKVECKDVDATPGRIVEFYKAYEYDDKDDTEFWDWKINASLRDADEAQNEIKSRIWF